MALREIIREAVAPHLLAVWLAAAGIATLASPFGTDSIPLIPRAMYWLVAMGGAVFLSNVIIAWSYQAPPLLRLPMLARGMVGAMIFSALYTVLLVGFGRLFFGGVGFPGIALMFGYVAPICVAITAVVHLYRAGRGSPTVAAPRSEPPPFFKRLKPALGRNLIRLSMQDHYVEVVTEKGTQLVLMRFGDALEELDGIAGWRIHRSHWVAEAGMRSLKRENSKLLIVMSDGAELPVSRTYMPALREAGVIKRLS